jgi:chorismate dehydratase
LNPPRVGCVKYLNARPLIHGWRGHIDFDDPAALCRQLARGDIDLALVSSFEFLRNPIYRIVDAVSLSSHGPVYSVIVAYHEEVSNLEEIELDPAAETSVNLLRCLLAELGSTPRLVARPTSMFTGRLLIGDQAIKFRQQNGAAFRYWDLGEQWKRIAGLPFVYALWLIRPEVGEAKSIADQLRALRDENLANIDELVAHEKDFAPEFCRRYYRDHLRFTFAEKEKQGLRAFHELCRKHELLPNRELKLELV